MKSTSVTQTVQTVQYTHSNCLLGETACPYSEMHFSHEKDKSWLTWVNVLKQFEVGPPNSCQH